MPEPGRSWENGTDYRYGYNGMETDPEVKEGVGNHYTTYFRQYDPRLGRWWSTDPVVQSGKSPYVGLGNNPIGLVDPLGATESNPLNPGGGSNYTGPSQGGGGGLGPQPGGGGLGKLFRDIGREVDRYLRRTGDAAMRSALRRAGRVAGRAGGGSGGSSTRGVYAGGGTTSAQTIPPVPTVVTPGSGRGTTIGPENFAPNTAGQIESVVKSDPGDVETTVAILLGPAGWGHLFIRHVVAPSAYDLVDDGYIVATDIVYEQGWSVRGARHMNGMGADGREQLDARLNVFMFGMGFVFTPELGGARLLSPSSGSSVADETIERTVALFDDAGRGVLESNVVTTPVPPTPTGTQLLQRGVESPKSYLDKALARQGLSKPGSGLKEVWVEDGYKYEVRVHPADPKYGKSGDIYRVGRNKQGLDANGQGYGWEYIDSQGNWHHTSVLKPGKGGRVNPNYNEQAAKDTHINVPKY